jgi:thioredoxin-related protein
MSYVAKAIVAAFIALASISPAAADALELVFFERPGCIYCVRWEREVGAVYPLTEEGRKAPLRRVNLADGPPPLKLVSPVIFSPTFVLMKDGREVGRITGYMGDAMFWGVFSKMMERLESPAT